LFTGVWLSIIGATVFGLTTLISPGELNSNENRINESLPSLTEEPTELQSPDLEQETQQTSLPFFILVVLLISCSGGSLLVTFALKYLVTSKLQKQSIKKSQKTNNFNLNYFNYAKDKPIKKTIFREKKAKNVSLKSEPIVTVIEAQEATPVDRRSPTLAETLDLRKRRSLRSILQDN
jgi:hypothetical protein